MNTGMKKVGLITSLNKKKNFTLTVGQINNRFPGNAQSGTIARAVHCLLIEQTLF